MYLQAILLVALIVTALGGFVLLPNLLGANAKRKRRKEVGSNDKDRGVDLFKIRDEPPGSGP